MYRKRCFKNKSLGLILILFLCLSIGYAAISRTLNITGNSEVKQNTWDIHFENVQIIEGSVTADIVPVANENNLTIEFSINLDLPGDFYEFTVDVKNSGSIDAMIDSILKTPTLTTAQAKFLNYIIEYQNGEEITSKQLVKSGKSVRLKVRVEYRKDLNAEDLPTTTETLNLGFTVNYVQADSTGLTVKDNGKIKLINVVSGDGTTKGNEVCIGEECFYVMYSDEDSVTMLSKYNLYVGGEYNTSGGSDGGWTAYGEEATGIQDVNMKGYVGGSSLKKGITDFMNIESASYVENYKVYLSTLGVSPIETRLISYDELINLGCTESDCKSAPSWVCTTTYWSGTIYSTNYVWNVTRNCGLTASTTFTYSHFLGVRPVIVIQKSVIVDTDS